MANCVKCRFSLNLQLFSVDLKSAPLKHTATYCPWNSDQIHSSCISMSLWWQNNSSVLLSWTVSIPKWVPILWHAVCAPSNAKLLEGGVNVALTRPKIESHDPIFFTGTQTHSRVPGNDQLFPCGSKFRSNSDIPANPGVLTHPRPMNDLDLWKMICIISLTKCTNWN